MDRPFAAFWLPLLVVLLGGPALAGRPDGAWSDAAVIHGTEANGAPGSDYVRAAATWHVALDGRLRKDHQPVARVGLLLAGPAATPAVIQQQLSTLRYDGDGAAPGQACHFPLFPTGPPSHA